jgi:Tfp pilus assembly protein PilF
MLLELNEILVKACEQDVRKRYQSANQLLADLQLAERGKSILGARKRRCYGKLLSWAVASGLFAVAMWFGANYLVDALSVSSRGPRTSAMAQANLEYDQGRYFYSKNTGEGLRKAIARFERAIEIDPRFAAAYGDLASCYSWGMPDFDMDAAKAKAYAERALSLDRNLAEAHKIVAWLKFTQYDWVGGSKEARRAISLAKNDPEVHSTYSVPLMWMGRTEESIAQLKQAQELDRTSLSIPAILGVTYMMARKDDLAIQEINKVMNMETNAPSYAFRTLAEIYEYQGSFLKAIGIREKWDQLTGNDGTSQAAAYNALRQAFKKQGASGYWRKQLDILKETNGDPYFIARCYAMLDDRENAFKWLETASARPSMLVQYLMNDRALDPLRVDRRFDGVIRRLKLDRLP